MRVAVCGGGLQGTELCFLAKKAGWHVELLDRKERPNALYLSDNFICADLSTELLGNAKRAVKQADIVLPAMENMASLINLENFCAKYDIPFAFDLEAWRVTRTKRECRALFKDFDIPIPGSVRRPDDYPYVLKPVHGSGSQGVKVIRRHEDLPAHIKEIWNDSEWILEKYCSGRQFSMEICGVPGDYKTFMLTEILVDSHHDCNCVVAPAPDIASHTEMSQYLLTLAQALELHGIMDIEAISSHEGMRVLEIDARFPSQTPIAIWLSTGINLAEYLVSCFIPYTPGLAKSQPHPSKYMHLCRKNEKLFFPGEHSLDKPLCPILLPGGTEILASRGEAPGDWNAVLLLSGTTWSDLQKKYQQVTKMLATNSPWDFV